eukprot:COSAG03_NODE_11602_length_585_cov_1.501031_1_plen_83_part_10
MLFRYRGATCTPTHTGAFSDRPRTNSSCSDAPLSYRIPGDNLDQRMPARLLSVARLLVLYLVPATAPMPPAPPGLPLSLSVSL